MPDRHSVAGHVRSAQGAPVGTLMLFSGRGPSELHDMLGIADRVDPDRRLLALSARDGGGRSRTAERYFDSGKVGFPDAHARAQELSAAHEWLDRAAADYGADPQRTVIVGFSHGGLIAASLVFGDRPVPCAGLALLSTPPPDQLDALAECRGLPVFIGHGDSDQLVPADEVDRFAATLRHAGLPVEHHLWDETSHRVPEQAHEQLSAWIFGHALRRAERHEGLEP
jgi:phospholipase/carboxylesterase